MTTLSADETRPAERHRSHLMGCVALWRQSTPTAVIAGAWLVGWSIEWTAARYLPPPQN